MSDERIHPPSNRRRQLAREQGMVARSGELTAAVALLALVVLLGLLGDQLATSLVEVIRAPLTEEGTTRADPSVIADRIRRVALPVLMPIAAIIGGVFVVAILAHQLQVGGLWVPSLLAPDPKRLWSWSNPSRLDPATRLGRAGWVVFRFGFLTAVAVWTLWSELLNLARLADPDPLSFAQMLFALVHGLAFRLALALLALGLLDLFWQHRRLESLLRATPEQHREDQRAQDGDPALRSRRRRTASEWWQHPIGVEAADESRAI